MKGEEERKTESKGRSRMGKRTVPLQNIFTIKNFSVLFGQTFTALEPSGYPTKYKPELLWDSRVFFIYS